LSFLARSFAARKEQEEVAERNEKGRKKGKSEGLRVVWMSSPYFSTFFVSFGYEFFGCGRRPRWVLCGKIKKKALEPQRAHRGLAALGRNQTFVE
jgi:hypothetical protein